MPILIKKKQAGGDTTATKNKKPELFSDRKYNKASDNLKSVPVISEQSRNQLKQMEAKGAAANIAKQKAEANKKAVKKQKQQS